MIFNSGIGRGRSSAKDSQNHAYRIIPPPAQLSFALALAVEQLGTSRIYPALSCFVANETTLWPDFFWRSRASGWIWTGR